jgi:hypothetical protein
MVAADTSWTKLPRRAASLAARLGVDRYGAWCWLISRAAWQETAHPAWGSVPPGCVAASTRSLAEAWGVGHHAARNILADLEAAGAIEVVRRAVGASGGQLISVQGTFSGTLTGTLTGTFQNSQNKTLMNSENNHQGTFSGTLTGTLPGRARTRVLIDSQEEFNRSARGRARSQYASPATDYSHIRTAPEILALGHEAEQAEEGTR